MVRIRKKSHMTYRNKWLKSHFSYSKEKRAQEVQVDSESATEFGGLIFPGLWVDFSLNDG